MNDFFENLKEYLFVLVIGLIIGILFLIKGYEQTEIKTKGQLFRYVIHGVLISMFITWLGFEVFIYAGLPYQLSVALGGALAYLGTDRLVMIIEKFIQKKL